MFRKGAFAVIFKTTSFRSELPRPEIIATLVVMAEAAPAHTRNKKKTAKEETLRIHEECGKTLNPLNAIQIFLYFIVDYARVLPESDIPLRQVRSWLVP